eukprot:6006698-Pyramimonas_sp.AAC.2
MFIIGALCTRLLAPPNTKKCQQYQTAQRRRSPISDKTKLPPAPLSPSKRRRTEEDGTRHSRRFAEGDHLLLI